MKHGRCFPASEVEGRRMEYIDAAGQQRTALIPKEIFRVFPLVMYKLVLLSREIEMKIAHVEELSLRFVYDKAFRLVAFVHKWENQKSG